MTEVQVRSEKCPVCNVEIDWGEQAPPNRSRIAYLYGGKVCFNSNCRTCLEKPSLN